ncbi:MAG: biotin/lipoyl-binding protein [Bacteroidia bacterium]
MKTYKFTINGNSYEVSVAPSDEDNRFQVAVNGTPYTVDLQQEVKQVKTPKLVRKEIPKPTAQEQHIPQTQSGGGKLSVRSPLPGTIVEYKVKVGDSVKKGDLVVILEAMKMQNQVVSEHNGVVRAIHAPAGQSVLQDQVLIDIEA